MHFHTIVGNMSLNTHALRDVCRVRRCAVHIRTAISFISSKLVDLIYLSIFNCSHNRWDTQAHVRHSNTRRVCVLLCVMVMFTWWKMQHMCVQWFSCKCIMAFVWHHLKLVYFISHFTFYIYLWMHMPHEACPDAPTHFAWNADF